MKTKFQLVTVGALALMTVFPVARAAVENTTQRPGQERAAQMQERREQRMKQLDEKLKLTAEQKTKIAAIWGKAAEEARAMRQDADLKRRELRKQQRATMKDTRAEIRALLTPEQQAVFDKLPRPKGKAGKAGLGDRADE